MHIDCTMVENEKGEHEVPSNVAPPRICLTRKEIEEKEQQVQIFVENGDGTEARFWVTVKLSAGRARATLTASKFRKKELQVHATADWNL